jgi:membrane protein DedA with SNARE-associated domain
MSPVSVNKFIFLNATGALVWAVAVGSGGYFFGHAVELIIGKVKSYEIYFMGSVSIVGLLIWIFHFYPRPRRPAKFITESR